MIPEFCMTAQRRVPAVVQFAERQDAALRRNLRYSPFGHTPSAALLRIISAQRIPSTAAETIPPA